MIVSLCRPLMLNDCPRCRLMVFIVCILCLCVVQHAEIMSVILNDYRIKRIVLSLCHCTGVLAMSYSLQLFLPFGLWLDFGIALGLQ